MLGLSKQIQFFGSGFEYFYSRYSFSTSSGNTSTALTLDNNNNPVQFSVISDAGTIKALILKYQQNGNIENQALARALGPDTLGGVAVDTNGDIIVGNTDRVTLAGGTTDKGLLTKWNSSLSTRSWVRCIFPATGSGFLRIQDVAVDSSNNVYFTGTVSDPAVPANNLNMVVQKYDADGIFQWGRTFATTEFEFGSRLVLAGTSVFVAGNSFATSSDTSAQMVVAVSQSTGAVEWQRTISLGGLTPNLVTNSIVSDNLGSLIISGTNNARTLRVTTKISTSGTLAWSKLTLGEFADVDSSGNIYVAATTGTVAKYDSSGNAIWSKTITSSGDFALSGIKLDSQGNYYLSASIAGQISIIKLPQSGAISGTYGLLTLTTNNSPSNPSNSGVTLNTTTKTSASASYSVSGATVTYSTPSGSATQVQLGT
jgi:hypothetical protein